MNKKKLNNNGFSLVELIIVIAIMAVLVGVLAPTYMQYVEKSKKSNDVSTVDSILNACEVAAVDPEVGDAAALTIVLSPTAATTWTGGGTKFNSAIQTVVGNDIRLKSKEWTGTTITIVATPANGKVSFQVSQAVLDYSSTLATRATAYTTP